MDTAEGAEGALGQRLDRCEVGHVGAYRERLAAARPDRVNHIRHACLVEVGNDDARACARKRLRQRAADAGRTARHDADPSAE